jgi:hypothetical protein
MNRSMQQPIDADLAPDTTTQPLRSGHGYSAHSLNYDALEAARPRATR